MDDCRSLIRYGALAAALMLAACTRPTGIDGQVLDADGHALAGAMVTLERGEGEQGPSATTVFTDAQGNFKLPDGAPAGQLHARLLNYRQAGDGTSVQASSHAIRISMVNEPDQAAVAPSSAWLAGAATEDKNRLVLTCVSCHQFPAPAVRNYARLIDETPHEDAADARRQSWQALVKYMNYISAWEFGRGGNDVEPDPNRAYSGGEAEPTGALIAKVLTGPEQHMSGYSYGAPLLANARTVIREYEVPAPNAVREAITLDDPDTLYVADVSSNRIVKVNAVTGAMQDLQIPLDRPMGPHTLVRGADDTLWATSFFHGTVAQLDPKTSQWQVWPLDLGGGKVPGVHDLSFGSGQNLLTDATGLIWYSDIGNNGVGWFDPKTGKAGGYPVPPVKGRVGGEQTYGLVMSADRKHIWYCQLGIGAFGSFNVETRKFENAVQFEDQYAGPRRMTISDQDVLYLALYGAGQLAEYDTKTQQMIGVYDLPDRASAPYSATWDPLRKVVWVATSNADVIYRFNPADKSFAVLPLPRQNAFLRMIQVDRHSGELITSYGNIVEYVHGPRMALKIDLGDRPEVSP
jgi:streptogramin lyase